MTAQELQHEIFELLHEKHVADNEKPTLFIGLQGDDIVVMQPGGEHFGIRVVPAKATIPG